MQFALLLLPKPRPDSAAILEFLGRFTAHNLDINFKAQREIRQDIPQGCWTPLSLANWADRICRAVCPPASRALEQLGIEIMRNH